MISTVNDGTNWILAYYQAMANGSVTVGKLIHAWYERIISDLEERRFFFDQRKANSVINFVERYCHHHEGPLAPGLITLELWQKAFLSVVYGIVDETGKRQFREIVLMIGRKQGKTALLSSLGCHHLYKDGGYGARVYVCAPKLEQAKLCYEGIYQTIRNEPQMERMAKRRRTDVYIEKTNSSAQPLAFSSKKSDGLNISMAILDEFGAFEGENGLRQAEVVKSSQGAREEPLMFYISTANFCEGLYDEIMKRSTAVIAGTSKETRLAPFLYMIDDPAKWDDLNELRKALPNLGVSVPVDYMLEEIAIAEGSLSKKSEFLTKYANIKQNASTAWLTSKDVQLCFPGNNYTFEDFRGCYALGGIDLSQTTDLTACVLLVERGGILYFFTQFFLPAAKIDVAIARDNVPYRAYIERGLLQVSGENFIDYHDCYRWFTRLIEEYEIYPLMIGYDKYSAQYLVQELESYGFKTEPVWQGFNLSPVYSEIEGLIKDGRIQCADDNDLMKIHLLDSAMKMETETNRRRLIKLRKNGHIDGVAALADAMLSRHLHLEEMPQLRNEEG